MATVSKASDDIVVDHDDDFFDDERAEVITE
jgi:hypothetical protein